jgi:hypothetical protein
LNEKEIKPEDTEAGGKETATESAPVAEGEAANPPAAAPATTGVEASEAAPAAVAGEGKATQTKKHDGKHVVLVIKNLRDRSTVKEVEETKDQAVILRQLREDVSSRFGGVDTKFSQMDGKFGIMDTTLTALETRFAKVEDILNRLALHMGL